MAGSRKSARLSGAIPWVRSSRAHPISILPAMDQASDQQASLRVPSREREPQRYPAFVDLSTTTTADGESES